MATANDDCAAAVETALAEVRPSFAANGASLVVVSATDTSVRIRLEFGPDACRECILPSEQLPSILLFLIRKTNPNVAAVVVDDPRDGTAADGHDQRAAASRG